MIEFISFLLSGGFSFITAAGVVVDSAAENAIRSQFTNVEKLHVRVDNAPTHQLLQGKIAKIRIAARGLQLKQYDFRIDALELETDEIAFFPRSIQKRKPKLKKPLQAGIRLVFTQTDINKLLQSPDVLALLSKLNVNTKDYVNLEEDAVYKFANPQFQILDHNRLFFQIELRSENNEKLLLIKVETGVNIINKGKQIQLIETVVTVNEEQVASQFVEGIVKNLNQRLDLRNTEGDGLLVRILKLNIGTNKLEIAAFVQIQPSYTKRAKTLSPSASSTKPLTQIQVISQPTTKGVR